MIRSRPEVPGVEQGPGTSVPMDAAHARVSTPYAARFAISSGRMWMLLAIFLPPLASMLGFAASGDIAHHILLYETGTLADADPFTIRGELWLSGQWVASTLIGGGFQLSGWAGLLLLRAVLFGLIFGLVYAACRGVGASRIVSSLVTLSAFIIAATSWALLVPQAFGLLFFAAVVAILVYRHKYPRLLWLVPLVMLLWANTHASFFIGWAAVGLAALEDIAARSQVARTTVVAGILSVFVTLINPWSVAMWERVGDLVFGPFIWQRMTEWQPTLLRSPTGLFLGSVALVLLLLILRLARRRSISWFQIAWLALLALVGVMAPWGEGWWAIGAAPILAALVGGVTILGRPLFQRDADQRKGLGYTAFAAALVLFALVALPLWRPVDAPYSTVEGALDGASSPRGDDFRVISVRGGWPGDSVESFEASLADGVLFAEADFVETADGYLVSGHEPQVGGECGDVSQGTLSQLRGCRLRTGEHLATLADFLALPFERAWVDLKSDAIPAAVAEIVRADRRDEVVLMVYDAEPADLDLMREAGVRGGLKGYPNTPDAIRHMVDHAASLGLELEVSQARWLTPDLVAYAQEQGIDILPWVDVGTPHDHVRELVKAGVVGLIVGDLTNDDRYRPIHLAAAPDSS